MTALSPAPDLSPEEAERVAKFDAAEEPEEVTVEEPEEVTVERVAVVLERFLPEMHRVTRRFLARAMATAALAALRGDRAPLAGQHTTDEEQQ